MEILKIDKVVKAYHNHIAVNGLSLDVPKGLIFGLLGPNGAGKTSLIRMITGITRPDSGTILFDGKPLDSSHPERIGYMPEERGLYKKMKVGEQLLYLAQLKGLSYADAQRSLHEWFEKFEIMSWWDKKVEELSKGMQQKTQFISTVLHKPELIILDEPFSGLDPINSNLIKDEIIELHRNGTTIIFSTHRMEQVEEMCDEIVLVNRGSNILNGKVKEIRQHFKENKFEAEFEGVLHNPPPIGTLTAEENRGHLSFQLSANESPNAVLQSLMAAGVRLTAYREILPTLNEIFIKQVGEHTHE